MKNSILLPLFLFFLVSAIAQNKPTKGSSGLGLSYQLNSSAVSFPSIKYDYYIDNSWVLVASYRPGFALSKVKNEFDEGNQTTNESTRSRYSQAISIGIEKHFLPKLKIDPFIGLNVTHGFSSKIKTKSTTISKSYGFTRLNENTSITPASNSIAASVNLGLSYFILKNLSFGIDLNVGNSFGFVNGKVEEDVLIRETDPEGIVTFEYEKSQIEKRKSNSSNLFYAVNLKMAFFFPLKKKEK